MEELKKYNRYSRKQIHDIFSPDTNFTPGAGYWGISGISVEEFELIRKTKVDKRGAFQGRVFLEEAE